ncbi:MAG TPA: hypothetical protein VNI20_11150 [Fimbriimonadaceae bacterium]|nr:hypothetical protein [Fimbriimonadaceae bacterium]
MVGTLIVATLLGASQLPPQEPLFHKLFPQPSGANALEYYVAAGDMAAQANDARPTKADADRQGTSVIELDRRVLANVDTANLLSLIKRGNSLPLTVPAGQDRYVIARRVKCAPLVLARWANVLFADGNSAKATDILLTLGEMAQVFYKSSTGLAIWPATIAQACDDHAFDSNLGALSLKDCDAILRRTPIPDTSFVEAAWAAGVEETRKEFDGSPDKMNAGYGTAFTPKDFDTFGKEWKRIAEDGTASLHALMRRPEAEWLPKMDSLSWDSLGGDSSLDDIMIGPNIYVEIAIRYRTRARLLRLAAYITKRKLEYAQPRSILDIPKEYAFDPATNDYFVYRRITPAFFVIHSKQTAWSQPIYLSFFQA